MELKRILLKKSFPLLLLLLLFVSAYFFIYQSTQAETDIFYYSDLYDEVLTELSALSYEDALRVCEDYHQSTTMQMIEGTWEKSAENYARLRIMDELGEQFSHLAGYEDYLLRIQDNAERLQGISLFSDKNSFAYKNTVKTAKDFAALSGIRVTAGHDLAVTKVFEDSWTDIISLIPILLVCALFLSERKNGLQLLTRTTPRGRCSLAINRILILLLASVITVVVLVGSRILFYGYLYRGLGEWGRSLQSISVFYNVPYPITVGGFWLRYLVVKALGLFLIGLLVWLIQSVIPNISAAIGVLGIIVGAEYAFTAIPLSSIFAALRYVNLFSYIDYFPVFSKYFNVSVLGIAVTGNAAACLMLLLLCAALSLCVLYVAGKQYPITAWREPALLDRIRLRLDRGLSGGGLFIKETKKLLVYRRGILALLLLLLLLPSLGVPERQESPIDMYLQYYEEKYAGPINEATMEQLKEELSAAQEQDRFAALNRLLSRCEVARDGAWLLPTAPYEALFTAQKYHVTVALVALLFLILLVSPIVSQERQAGATLLLSSTPAGRKKLWQTKQALLLLCTLIVWVTVYGSELIRLTDVYGTLSCLNAPIYSLTTVTLQSWQLTVGQALLLIYALRFAVLLTAAELCLLLSLLCRRNSDAIMLCCGVLLLPAALAGIGSFIGQRLSLLLPLTVIDLAPQLWQYLMILLLFLLSLAASRYLFTQKA